MRRIAVLLVALALVVGIAERGRDLLEDYEGGHRGACAALFSILAKNHLRYGILETGGVPVLNPVKVAQEHFAYYTHHPPGAVLVAWVGAGLTGTRAAGLRFVFLLFSIGIVLVVGRLARGSGSPARAAALCVAALTPALVYYGPFPNFELPTMFFALLALHLALRALRRGRTKDAWRAAWAQAFAVGCDWIALGLPILLALLVPLRRPGLRTFADGRRVRTGLVLGLLFAASALVVVLVQIQYGWQASRYGASADGSGGNALAYLIATTPLARDFDAAAWVGRVGGYARELFGAPLLVVAALGLLATLPSLVRRRLGDTELAAWVVLGLGIGNQFVLAKNATGHDYYVLYAAPALALFAATLVRRISADSFAGARAAAGLALVAALSVVLAMRSHALVEQRENYALARLGREIADQTAARESDPIFLYGDYTLQVVAQSDRYVRGVATLPQLKAESALAVRYGMGGRPTLYLAAHEAVSSMDAGLRAWLDGRSRRATLGPFTAWELGPLSAAPAGD